MNFKKIDQSKLVEAKMNLQDFLDQVKLVKNEENQETITISLLLLRLEPILNKLHSQTKLIAEFNRQAHEKKNI
jgi:hypothetical protein